ncbi:hypothetical protein LIMNO130_80053 [Limnobacter sp. 130]|nr:hypothetical protein LIMNO130_80053 [Limnobacter sp. 130]
MLLINTTTIASALTWFANYFFHLYIPYKKDELSPKLQNP